MTDIFTDFNKIFGTDLNHLFGKAYNADSFEKALKALGNFYLLTKNTKTDKGFDIQVEVPGFTADEIEIVPVNGYLAVNAKHAGEGNWMRKEFSAKLLTYKDDDLENITSVLKNGVLTISIPKKIAPEPKRIRVTVG
jgi:HSP20 family protein